MSIRSRRYLIVGDGAAGFTAARALRSQDGHASITVVSDDPSPAYFRAALTNYLLGELREEQIWASTPHFYDQHRVQRVHGRVIGLDAARAELHLSHGGTPLQYDALLIASGARARPPEFQGRHLSGVLTLRTLQDCRGVMEQLLSGKVKHSVVLGGGPLALEWALGMHARGVKVTVLLRGTTFMAGALDAVASDLLAARLRQAGVQVLSRDEVALAADRGNGSVGKVRTKNGQELPCDLLAAAIGVIPNTEWLQRSGLQLSRGGSVIVDERMQASLPHVFAAGDVVELNGRVLQLWEPAQTQAQVAARNMAGHHERYTPGVHYMATRLFDLDFASLGEVSASNGAEELSELPQGTGTISYQKVVLRNQRLVGALMLGQREAKVRQRGRLFKRLIDSAVDVSSVKAQLLNEQFDLKAWLDNSAMMQRDAAPEQRGVAQASHIKGTSVLNLAELEVRGRAQKKPATSGAADTNPKARGTQVLSGFTLQPETATPSIDSRAATMALGTQVLSTFNARPKETPQHANVAATDSARPAGLLFGQQRILLSQSLIRIGRDPSGEVVLHDPAVDFSHAHLQRALADWYLRDVGSRAGTWLNGQSLNVPRRLETGDRLQLGSSELVFFFCDEEAKALQRRADPAALAGAVQGKPRPRFELRSGHGLGLSFVLSANPTAIGSDPSSALWLSDPEVAPRQAEARQNGTRWQLSAVAPGLFVNGAPLAPQQQFALVEGCRLQIGRVEMLYTETPLPNDIAVPAEVPRESGQQRARMQAFHAVGQPSTGPHSAAAAPHSMGQPGVAPTPHSMAAHSIAAHSVAAHSMAAPTSNAARFRLRADNGSATAPWAWLGEVCLVGTAETCQLRLNDPALAPVHLELRQHQGSYWARAFAHCSQNGAALTQDYARVRAGDRFQLGAWNLLCEEAAQ